MESFAEKFIPNCPSELDSDLWRPCPSGLDGDPWCHCLSGLHGDLSGHHFFQLSALFSPATPNCTITSDATGFK